MKRFVSAFIILVLLALSSVTVSADSKVSFSLGNVECASNRLIEVPITANGSSDISAVVFEFSYDSDFLEFKKIIKNGATVEYNDTGSKVIVSYLVAFGKEISIDTELFSLQFKSLQNGETHIDILARDLVNSDAEFVDISECKSSTVKIASTYATASSSSKSSDSSNSKNKSDVDSAQGASEQSSEFSSGTGDEFSNLGVFGNVSDKSTMFMIVGIVIGASVIAVAFIAYFIIKKTRDKRNQKDNDIKAD